ncbi:MAG: MBOAT family protein [Alphaproteobacteria bacterium]|nr:MBOAT family protein [Alphaproteobacteria bacterium]
MLFNSFEFIFLFLPVAVVGYFGLARFAGATAAQVWLIAASIFFYGWWNPVYLPLLGALMVFTYLVGKRLSKQPSRLVLGLGIAVLLGVLGYYKYANFFVANVDALTGADWAVEAVVLPLAISFFTFQKIAYLVDSHRGLTRDTRPLEFTLFVVFFPQLIAGPIVHWKEILPQFRLPEAYRVQAENIAVGLAIFALGLFKKAVLADGIAVHATPTFNAAEAGVAPDLLTAWAAALAYTLQLYFDFSGYSDMAIGSARLFGIRLPLNFNSPYKAANIIDFWRRWHMTLSRFLRDYLYIALGGNRRGPVRRYANLMATMLLGGLWHGAGWPFVLWGGLHGLYLVINHAWRRIVPESIAALGAYRFAAWLVTFVAVVVAWVPFRAPTLEGAGRILAGMAGLNGVALPNAIGARLGGLRELLEGLGVGFALGGGSAFVMAWLWIVALGAIAVLLPNTQQIMRGWRPALDLDEIAPARRLLWAPTRGWALATAAVAVGGTLALTQVSEFLYFQF